MKISLNPSFSKRGIPLFAKGGQEGFNTPNQNKKRLLAILIPLPIVVDHVAG
jgi:hypothetical protein